MGNYQLFIGRYKELPEEEFTYYTPQSGYMLVYTNKYVGDKDFKKVLPEKECKLLQEEKSWLSMTRLTIVCRNASVGFQEATENIERFSECLRKALKEVSKNNKEE